MGRMDIPLNESGEKQVLLLRETMRMLPLDAVYSSPQLRAKETAEAVAAGHKMPVQVTEALAEVDFPAWVGKGWDELQIDPVYQMYHLSPATARHEAFEAITDVQKRTSSFLEELVRAHPGARIALVSHADPLRTILSHLLNFPLSEFRRFRISNASLSVLEGPPRWGLKLFNYRSDLQLNSDV